MNDLYVSRWGAAKTCREKVSVRGWTTARCVAHYDGFFTALSRDLLLHFHPHFETSIGNLDPRYHSHDHPEPSILKPAFGSIRFLAEQNAKYTFY